MTCKLYTSRMHVWTISSDLKIYITDFAFIHIGYLNSLDVRV